MSSQEKKKDAKPNEGSNQHMKELRGLKKLIGAEREKGSFDAIRLTTATSRYFTELHKDICKKNIFTNLLEYQIHEKLNNPNKFNFHFNVPFFEPIFLFNMIQSVHRNIKNYFFLTEPPKNKIFIDAFRETFYDFFEKNPDFYYYFWNVTFPNLFSAFFSEEYSLYAQNFVNLFKNDFKTYSIGVISFIKHNYLFQDVFYNVLFKRIYGNNNNDAEVNEENIFESFIYAISRLNKSQNEVLQDFIKMEGAMELIIKEIMIPAIRNMEYAPLFTTNDDMSQENNKCITILERTVTDTNSLKNYAIEIERQLENAFEFGVIRINELVYVMDVFQITVCDMIILLHLFKDKDNLNDLNRKLEQPLSLDQPLSLEHLTTTAFHFFNIDHYFDANRPSDSFSLEGDPNLINAWNRFRIECQNHGKDPIEEVMNDDILNDINFNLFVLRNEKRKIEHSQKCIAELKRRMHYSTPMKTFIEAQETYIKMVCPQFAIHFPFSKTKDDVIEAPKKSKNGDKSSSMISEDFLRNKLVKVNENFECQLKQFYMKHVSAAFIEKVKKQKKALSQNYDENKFNELLKKFDTILKEKKMYFVGDDRVKAYIDLFANFIFEVKGTLANLNLDLDLTASNLYDFLDHFSRAYTITHFDQRIKAPVYIKPDDKKLDDIKPDDKKLDDKKLDDKKLDDKKLDDKKLDDKKLDDKKLDDNDPKGNLGCIGESGIFSYIIEGLPSSKIVLGKYFEVIPVLKKFFEFVNDNNNSSLKPNEIMIYATSKSLDPIMMTEKIYSNISLCIKIVNEFHPNNIYFQYLLKEIHVLENDLMMISPKENK